MESALGFRNRWMFVGQKTFRRIRNSLPALQSITTKTLKTILCKGLFRRHNFASCYKQVYSAPVWQSSSGTITAPLSITAKQHFENNFLAAGKFISASFLSRNASISSYSPANVHANSWQPADISPKCTVTLNTL